MPAIGLAYGGYMLPILGTLNGAGWNAENALSSVGLRPDLNDHPDQTIPHILAIRFIEKAARIFGDEDFAPIILSEGPSITLDMVPSRGVPILSNPMQTLRSVVEVMNRTTTSYIRMRTTKRSFWVDLFWTHGEEKPPWSAELYVACLMISTFRGVLGKSWVPQRMKLLSAHRSKASVSALPDCPLDWHAPSISLAIDKNDMVFRLTRPSEISGDVAETKVPDLSTASPETVRQAIEGLLVQDNLGLSEIAECFGLSKRSFQRQLDAFDLKFGIVLDDYRVSRAISSLRSGEVSITELSLDLGYDHPQNFSRAFKRRVGQSPREFRKTLQT